MGRTKAFDDDTIIDQAMQLFWKHGYHGISTQELIDAFGLSKSSLYGTFSDKRNLFLLALKRYNNTATQTLTGQLNGKGTFRTRMKGLLMHIMNATCDDADNKGCFLVNTAIELAPHDAEILDIVGESRQQMLIALTAAIREAKQSGELSADANAKALAGYFGSVISGLRVDGKISKNKTAHRATIAAALSVLD